MPELPLISIIVPTFNRAHLIVEMLDSVLKQTYRNWECLVIDDGSSDQTEVIVNTYITKDVRFQYHKRTDAYLKGGNGSRNYGFRLSKGEYVQWFDDDDVMLPLFLERRLALFDEDSDMVIGSGIMVDNQLKVLSNIDLKLETFLYKDYVFWNFKIVTNNVLFKKSYLDDKKLFLEVMERGQEAELFSRLFYNISNKQYKILNEALFLYRQHEVSKTKINVDYVPGYKKSESFYFIENLKRSIEIKDNELCDFLFSKIIKIFFLALDNYDVKVSNYLLKELNLILWKKHKFFLIQLNFINGLSTKFDKRIYRIDKSIRNYKAF